MSSNPPIAGYRQLEPSMIELANNNKLIEELVLRQLDRQKADPSTDGRLNQMAFSHFQIGFMLMNRAVFQPTRIAGHIDIEALMKELVE